MNSKQDLSPIIRAVTVPAATQRAFKHFVDDFGDWWPREYTWAGEALHAIHIEKRIDGHCFELGPGAFRNDWGTVLAYDPPRRLLITWQVNPDRTPQPDPQRAGEVEVHFMLEEPGFSRVTVEHRGFERCGPGGLAYRAVLDGDAGWTYILASYAGYCEVPADVLTD